MIWSREAEERIKKAPFFIRGLAKRKAEEVANSLGKSIVEVEDIERAKKSGDLQDLSKIDLSIEGITESTYKEIKPCGGMKGCPLTLLDDEAVVRCLHGVLEREGVEKLIEAQHQGPILYHHKFKAAVSGCPNSCSQPQIKDIGIVGYRRPITQEGLCIGCSQCVKTCPEGLITLNGEPSINYRECIDCGRCIGVCPTGSIQEKEKGYRIVVGGRLGRRPHLAEELANLHSLEELEEEMTKVISLYKRWIMESKTISHRVETLGVEKIKEILELQEEKKNAKEVN